MLTTARIRQSVAPAGWTGSGVEERGSAHVLKPLKDGRAAQGLPAARAGEDQPPVGREANRRKVEKHFDIAVTDDDLTFKRNAEKIAAEARLDGIYIVRTSLDANAIGAHEAVAASVSRSNPLAAICSTDRSSSMKASRIGSRTS